MLTNLPQLGDLDKEKTTDDDLEDRDENENDKNSNNEWEALPEGLDPITEQQEEEELQSTTYANNVFAIDEEKQQLLRGSLISEDVRSTDIEEESTMTLQTAAEQSSRTTAGCNGYGVSRAATTDNNLDESLKMSSS